MNALMIVLCLLVFASSYVNFSDLDTASLIGCAIYMVVLVIYCYTRYGTVKKLKEVKE